MGKRSFRVGDKTDGFACNKGRKVHWCGFSFPIQSPFKTLVHVEFQWSTKYEYPIIGEGYYMLLLFLITYPHEIRFSLYTSAKVTYHNELNAQIMGIIFFY